MSTSTVTNTLSTSLSTAITISPTGSDQSPFTITSTGTINPVAVTSLSGNGTNGVSDPAGTTSGITLVNQGVIYGGTHNGTYGYGGAGVFLQGVNAFSNSGTIIGGNGGNGNSLNGGGAGVYLEGAGNFSNQGVIVGGTSPDLGGKGLALYGSGTFTNHGTLGGGGGSGDNGSGAFLVGGELINAGLIEGGNTGGATPQGDAVNLSGTTASTLIVESGATFIGNIVANTAAADILAIGGTTAIDLTGLGTQFQNFNTLAFEPGSSGTFAGSITNFTRVEGLDVNGFTASTPLLTIGAGGVVLITASSASQTLDLTFASAAIGDVLTLTTTTSGTSITIDPHILNNSIATGITLTPTGAYQSPFTITSAGTIAPGYSGGLQGIAGVSASAISGLTLINQGLINGGGDLTIGGDAVILSGANTFTNSGTLTGGVGGDVGGTGLLLSGAGMVTNTGAIDGGNASGRSINGSLGGYGAFLNGGTLINDGLVAGGFNISSNRADAIYFGTNASTLIVYSGATFQGNVVANATVSDILAIGGGTGIDLTGIGTQFTNFHTIAFEPGATGTFAGSLSGLNNDAVDGFSRGDGLYLNGFTASTPLATIGAGGVLAIAGSSAGQTLDLTFASAAIGDVLDLTNTTGGTSLHFDPHNLNQSIATGITLTPTGSYQSAFTITSQGTITPSYSNAAFGVAGVNGAASSGLTLINQGLINGGGAITVGGDAVALRGVNAFSNSGTLRGGAATNAGGNGARISGSGIFTNSGSILGGTGGNSGGNGLDLYNTGTFTNSGTLTGGTGGNSGGNGLSLYGTGVFTNTGNISGGTANNDGVGVLLNGGTLINAGLIAGGSANGAFAPAADAILFGTNVSSLIVYSGATFFGSIIANATLSDILAIGGTAAVSLSGIGTQFQNFHTIAFEPGATGTFAGSLNGLNNEIVDGFARSDALYVNGFAASTTLATIGAGGILAVAGASTGQTLDLIFAPAAIGDVLNLSNTTGGTSITIDPHILNNSISTGISLSPTGAYQSPFTVTSQGTINPSAITAARAYGTSGISNSTNTAASGVTLVNQGMINGGNETGANGYGGEGVYLLGVSAFSNSGTISGGIGGTTTLGSYGGIGVFLSGPGTFNNQGLIDGGTSAGKGGLGLILSISSTFTNQGTIDGGTGSRANGTGVYLESGELINSGLIAGGLGGSGTQANAVQFGIKSSTLVVESGATFQGNVVANLLASDTLAIGGTTAVSLSGIGTQFQNFSALAFDSGSTGTVTGTYTALENLTVTGFAQGDTLILDGFGATSETYVTGTGLELSNGTSSITLDITGSFSSANFNVIDPPTNTTISLNAPCFAQGTKILTQRGEIPVENLTLNDHVILHGGGTAPIQWIGHRKLSLRRHPNPEQVRPIRVQAGAILDGIPRRDLVLSPDHALYLNGALIPAKALLNGSTIRQEAPAKITYFHIELANHSILYAEGTPTESYLETGNRHAFTNGSDSHLTLHPNFAQTQRERESCAPFTESGPLVEAVRARILARANQTFTTDPALSLHTNKDGSVTILSRSAIPGQLNPDPRDQRRLGVKIASLTTESGANIPLNHPLLTEGWHNPEPDGRWTNGRSVIPAELVRGEKIILAPAATLAYPATDKTEPRRRSA